MCTFIFYRIRYDEMCKAEHTVLKIIRMSFQWRNWSGHTYILRSTTLKDNKSKN